MWDILKQITLLLVLIVFTLLGCKENKPKTPIKKVLKDNPMVIVPAGDFMMGCNEEVDDECEDDEKPYHKVYLDEFYIDQYEVTVDEYTKCLRAGECEEPDKISGKYSELFNWGKYDRGSHPINGVNWQDAKSYCKYVRKRLPTEAEWEKAARGVDGRKYSWGNEKIGSSQHGNFADLSAKSVYDNWGIVEGYDDGYAGTSQVGSFPEGASPYGAMDMIGNVYEWTSDWYDDKYYSKSPYRNPKGAPSGMFRVCRGGSYSFGSFFQRASDRSRTPPFTKIVCGFRCAMDARK